MKKNILILLILIGFSLKVNAQMMNPVLDTSSVNWNEILEHTLREEKEGKELWEKFRNKEVDCSNLNDEQFGTIGEYFMGQMTGESHAAMNAMMIQRYGQEGEEQMHIIMGKHFLGCNTTATSTMMNDVWMPMMNMMGGWFYSSEQNKNQNNLYPFSNNNLMNNMMGFGFGPFSWFNWIFTILFWILIIVGVIALIKWFMPQNRKKYTLNILKERYAKGEINKEEFEEKKKNLI